MKTMYFFCTKLWIYLTEIPPLALFAFALYSTSKSENKFTLLPLMIMSVVAAILIFLFFFRMVSLNNEQIRAIGPFSSKDSEFIKENSFLLIKLSGGGNMKLELWGGNPEIPAFDWMKAEDSSFREICLFREKALGGVNTAKRIAKYFTAPDEALDGIEKSGFSYENDTIALSTDIKNEVTEIKLLFKKIII